MPLLSIAMIVRDEEKNLDRALKSVASLPAELVIVDTGSVDKTVEIAQRYTKNVYHQKWTGDFALHRNYSFSRCTGDWILGFDADEEFVFAPGVNATHLAEILKKVPAHINTLSMVVSDIRKGVVISGCNSVRFFRNGSTVWKRAIHNKPDFAGPTAPLRIASLNHYGYDLTPEQAKKKAGRTITGLLAMIEKNPADYQSLFYLSQAYAVFAQDEAKTLHYGEAYIAAMDDNPEFNPSVFYTIIDIHTRRGNLERSFELLKLAIERFPGNCDIYWRWLEAGLATKDPLVISNAAQVFVAAYDAIDSYKDKNPNAFFFTDRARFLVQALYYLSMAHFEQGQVTLKRIVDLMDQLPVGAQTEVEGNVRKMFTQLGVTSDLVDMKPRIITGGAVSLN